VERRQASVLRNQHAAVPAARQVEASVCRRSASLFPSSVISLRSFVPFFVIAGLDPAIHAEATLDQTSGRISQAAAQRHHRIKSGGDEENATLFDIDDPYLM
jgi:hypothetical protein